MVQKYDTGRNKRWESRILKTQQKRLSQIQGHYFLQIILWRVRSVNLLNQQGSVQGLTILVQFPDDPQTVAFDPVDFPTDQAKVERFCNEIGFDEDGNTGSIRDYFLDQSLNQLDYTNLVTYIITLPKASECLQFQ